MIARIRILHAGPDPEKLVELLEEAGLEIAEEAGHGFDPAADREDASDDDEIDERPSDDETEGETDDAEDSSAVEDDEVCVIVVGEDLDGSVEAAARQAAGRGARVVGIWHPSRQVGELPRVLDEYGSGCVPWDARSFGEIVRGEGESWHRPDGGARGAVPTKRNRC